MKRLAIMGLLVLVAAGPATKPTSQPAAMSVADAQVALIDAKQAAGDAFDRSAAGRAMVADVAEKQATLEAARSSGTPQDRLDASAAWNAARISYERAKAVAVDATSGVKAAQAALVAAQDVERMAAQKARADEADRQRQRDEAARAAQAEKEKDPIYQAIKANKFCKGMTQDQADQVMNWWKAGVRKSFEDTADGDHIVNFQLFVVGTGEVGRTSRLVFRKGILVDFRDEEADFMHRH